MNSRKTLRGVQNGKLDELIEICNKAYHGGNMNVWEWTKRRCAALRSTDEYLVRIRELAVNGLLYSCSVLETNPPNNEDVRTALEERCGGFETEEEMVDKGLVRKIQTMQILASTLGATQSRRNLNPTRRIRKNW